MIMKFNDLDVTGADHINHCAVSLFFIALILFITIRITLCVSLLLAELSDVQILLHILSHW